MIKIISTLLLFFGLVNAKMIGGIAMSVDGEPITIGDIKRFQQSTHLSKQDAINALIQQKLEEKVIAQNGIFVNDYEIERAMENIAKQNGITVAKLQQEVQKQGLSLAEYKNNLAKGIKKEKLYAKIFGNRLKKPTDEEVRSYYDAHKREFRVPGSIHVLEYSSPKGELLAMLQKNPMLNPKGMKGIRIKDINIDPTKVNPQLVALLKKTPNSKFTPIINTGKGYVMFFVKGKNPPKTIPFSKIKDRIFAILAKENQAQLINEYFQKLKSEAIIKTVRNF